MSIEAKSNGSPSDLSLNNIGCFPLTLTSRRETIDSTLELFRLEDTFDTNKNLLDRTSHLYRTSAECLEPLRQELVQNADFTHVEIAHRSSLLGLPYQIYAKHISGSDIHFDGLSYWVRKQVRSGGFRLQDVPSLAGYPPRADEVVMSLKDSLASLLPEMPSHSYTMVPFFAADVGDWSDIGLNATGESQLRLEVLDESFVTTTALRYAEQGKSYALFLGESKTIAEMISHEVFLLSEYTRFSAHVDSVRRSVGDVQAGLEEATHGSSFALLRFLRTYKSWKDARNGVTRLYKVRKTAFQYGLLSEAIRKIVEGKWSVRNFPRQIWLAGEGQDDEWQSSSWCANFFTGKLEKDGTIELGKETAEPIYRESADELTRKISLLRQELDSAIDDGRDVRSIIQTDFALEAVTLAVITLMVSAVIGLTALNL